MKIFKKHSWILVLAFAAYADGVFAQLPIYDSTIVDESQFFQDEKTLRVLESEAKKLHKSAIKKYRENRYWESAIDLVAILEFHKQFSKADEVTYRLADCLYQMAMYEGADRMYRHLLKVYSRTLFVAEAILGLQKVWYEKGDYQTSLKFYKALESHYSDHKTIDESRYYAGQTYFHLENYNRSLSILRTIDKKDQLYSFSLYTIGLIDLKKKA